MESAMACEMIHSIYDDGAKVDTLVMDNDSTTIARLRATVDSTISKQADKNHTKKGFTSSLFDLINSYKILKNTKVRGHIEKCFIYCISQNKGQPKAIADGLQRIVPHLYGEHDACGLWCKNEKKDYKPRPFVKQEVFCIPWRIYTETSSKDGEEIEKSTPSPKSFQFQKETIGIKVPEGNEKLHTISVRR